MRLHNETGSSKPAAVTDRRQCRQWQTVRLECLRWRSISASHSWADSCGSWTASSCLSVQHQWSWTHSRVNYDDIFCQKTTTKLGRNEIL